MLNEMENKDILREAVIKGLAEMCSGQKWTEYVTVEQVVDAIIGCPDHSKLEELVMAKRPAERPYALSMKSLGKKGNPNTVAGYWEICAVRDAEQFEIQFSTKASKVLYTFFLLHAGEEFTLAGLQKYHGEFVKIALALYAVPGMEHTRKTKQWAEEIATRLTSRTGLSGKDNSNQQRSEEFARAKKAMIKAFGEKAGIYVIQGSTGDPTRVLRLPQELAKVPYSFRDEVIGWQGGLVA